MTRSVPPFLNLPAEVRASYPDTFQAIWPVTDSTIPPGDLIKEATRDIRAVAARHRVEYEPQHGRFAMAPALAVPGAAGGLTDTVLIYEAPGRAMAPRPYHHDRRATA